ncbi:Uncharacterised protein [Scardovia inopinata]|uniref:Uncharacterized protein n=1 Tax=Scardovia inopinata F0304 TaxID=641146 RepID=W5II85_SCAIO|nr:DUF6020 family protein [Scardovia inopinata]EFG26587.2 hypothetical protein HMPREF9020_00209 [Scardovia inopinata F0304]BAR06184.1 hypothetical protein SCIP_0117 [Scardovia inopinata JCM 12537]SUV51704.1 Uncharacterised protein [Scardovia inopinata]
MKSEEITGGKGKLSSAPAVLPALITSLVIALVAALAVIASGVIDIGALQESGLGFGRLFGLPPALIAYLRRTGLQAGIVAFVLTMVVLLWAGRVSRPFRPRNPGSTSNTDRLSNRSRSSKLSFIFGPSSPMTFGRAFRRYGWIFWLSILISWVPVLMTAWPGALRDDTLAQFFQSQNVRGYYTRHPLMGTFIFGLFWKAGEALGNITLGLVFYIIVQAVALSLCSALVLSYMRKCGTPLFFIWLSLLYFAASYQTSAAVPTMSKDSLWAIVMTPFALIFIEACQTRGRILKRRPVLISFIILAFLVMTIKRTGQILVLASGFFLFLLVVFSGRQSAVRTTRGKILLAARVLLAFLLPALVTAGIWNPLSIKAVQASSWEPVEFYGLFTQPLARLYKANPQSVSAGQRKEINRYMDLSIAAEAYNPSRMDETMYTSRRRVLSGKIVDFIKLWAKIGLSSRANSSQYLKAYLSVWRGWFSLQNDEGYPTESAYIFTPSYMQQWGREVEGPDKAFLSTAHLRAGIYRGMESRTFWASQVAGGLKERRQAEERARKVEVCLAAGATSWGTADQMSRGGRNLTEKLVACRELVKDYREDVADSEKDQSRKRIRSCIQEQGNQMKARRDQEERVDTEYHLKRQPVKGLSDATIKVLCQAGPAEKLPRRLGPLQVLDSLSRSMGITVTLIPLALGLFLLLRRRWAALASWSFAGLFLLQLYLSPASLIWYAIPLFFLLPAFGSLIFQPAQRAIAQTARQK